MTRKDFLRKVGFGAAIALTPVCIGGLAVSCDKDDNVETAPTNIDFTLDVATGSLATDGGFMVTNRILVARTLTGQFIAISAACTHQGTNVNYVSASDSLYCPNHGATFTKTGVKTGGPGSGNLTTYNTNLTGNSLRVYS